ncbi:cellulose biosynthesis protein BcsQ [Sphingopyxis italica]|uniref:Cellulose biosynthesis protein BcsQ n=1 Tax=Sphingopyxis italica TaxID=1129133 RepID=A0A7X6BB63_9SPHN|nr:ParA family protein [Sphingopyxis italica]NJB91218.1 cellulose biosynthesis protein BcsQ [Sphingopyxis italica]
MVKVVSLYNHKGGVSKTTSTFNLAHKLRDRGHKVLVVDADPQCNMTELMLAQRITELDAQSEETGEEYQLEGTTLLQALKPRIEGTTSEIDIDAVELIETKENLFLLRGDVGLSDIEDALSEAHSQRFSDKIHEKRTYVAIGDFFERISQKLGFNFILIDVGPSSGAITRACFLSCDGFFVPTVPDRFNVQALGTLSAIFDRWLKEHSQIVDDFKTLGLPVRPGRPKFLGMIVQNFKKLSGVPKKGYKFWMDKLPVQFAEKLKPVLEKYSIPDDDLTFGYNGSNCAVAAIPDFVSLAPLMQELGKPVFGIEQADSKAIGPQWQGNVWIDKVERMNEFSTEFDRLAEIAEKI